MALFLVEREFAEALDLDIDTVEGVVAINDEVGVRWVTSLLSADKRKTYCLYEAESEAAIIEAARRAGVPADVVVAVDQFVPDELLARR
ncbi:MAG: nickel-binding protein [Ilumatobacteraceae bacterium]